MTDQSLVETSTTEQPPDIFTAGEGRRLPVIAHELARCQWYEERGLPDPVKVSAARLIGLFKT